MSKCNKIRHIVRIQQILKRWRRKARVTTGATSSRTSAPSDVPAGHVAVCVGASCKRFVVRATYLNHPIFKNLLVEAEEVYGFKTAGPLAIPCDEAVFEEILRVVSKSDTNKSGRILNFEDLKRCCHVGMRRNIKLLGESRPLLHG
ncbi:SMALL AUXIN-UP RNA-RELATED [Salix viminalis]|uniref:SMALL AUXIN-UP RNA-RELATED n=5 Tax=Salix TaxID=40685 RepID=A0A6N2MEA8_SALVM|nr:hypothetical protein DKX38_006351 [Salix brachista]KAG5247854.1 auxin-induced protein [Salix suchowensis]KAJ6707963.1 SMALL AUXIN-UP RNA-RELATED [Salix viminalis]KAJ6739184.1 SMALL AUXIN-UP RNA-RELATED [Salix koriyanagi]KAJ6765985.1 SMALL AUXIN-UP RNA-RELATED [Salix purpurea]